jgi:hypothetical protein
MYKKIQITTEHEKGLPCSVNDLDTFLHPIGF